MLEQCPGQNRRKVKPENIVCTHCGYLAEIFSDEIRVVCPKCKSLICKERMPTCVNWCKAARECIGEEKYRQLKAL